MTGKDRPSGERPKGRIPEKEPSLPDLFTYKRADVSALVKRLRREFTQSSKDKTALPQKTNSDSLKPEKPDQSAAREPTARNLIQVRS